MPQNKRNIRRTVIILLCIMAVFVGAAVSRIVRAPQTADVSGVAPDTVTLQKQGAFIRPDSRPLEHIRLIDSAGQPFTEAQFAGHWSLVFLGYTHCPDICPTTLALFKQLREEWLDGDLGDIRYVLLSADPERDTAARLHDYLQFFHADFIGLTGSVAEVDRLAKQLNSLFARVPQEAGDYLVDHSGNVMIVNPDGEYVGFIRPPHSVGQFALVMETLISAY